MIFASRHIEGLVEGEVVVFLCLHYWKLRMAIWSKGKTKSVALVRKTLRNEKKFKSQVYNYKQSSTPVSKVKSWLLYITG